MYLINLFSVLLVLGARMHCPDKVEKIQTLLRRFSGREEQLMRRVRAKYGVVEVF